MCNPERPPEFRRALSRRERRIYAGTQAERQIMTEEEALLEAIRNEPEDDTPRLVLADWYAENGQEDRGEFVRIQIELAASAKRMDSVRPANFLREHKTTHDLQRREQSLCAAGAHGIRIPGLVAGLSVDYFGHLHDRQLLLFRRGFPDAVRLTLLRFCGGPCGQCDRYRAYRRDDPTIGNPGHPCSICSRPMGADEHEPGLAAELFRWPITAVVLTDRLPALLHHSGGYRPPSWHGINEWNAHAEPAVAHTVAHTVAPGWLPPELWAEVRKRDLHDIEGPGSVLSYGSVEDALKALSDGCVAYGRKRFEESRKKGA